MQTDWKGLLVAVGAILVGIAAFFVIEGMLGAELDQRPMSVLEWSLAGVLAGPGIGLLLRWRRARDMSRRA